MVNPAGTFCGRLLFLYENRSCLHAGYRGGYRIFQSGVAESEYFVYYFILTAGFLYICREGGVDVSKYFNFIIVKNIHYFYTFLSVIVLIFYFNVLIYVFLVDLGGGPIHSP